MTVVAVEYFNNYIRFFFRYVQIAKCIHEKSIF